LRGGAAPAGKSPRNGCPDQACERREDEVVRDVRTDEPAADLHAATDAEVADQADCAEDHDCCADRERDPER